MKKSSLLIIQIMFVLAISAQESAWVKGVVKDDANKVLEFADVFVQSLNTIMRTDINGRYILEIPGGQPFLIQARLISYAPSSKEVSVNPGDTIEVNFVLNIITLGVINIYDKSIRQKPMTRISPKLAANVPSVRGGIEDLVISQLGVSSSNELSSTYSVRGGSFDENLVYVNDIEVYRPFLTRSGQQEGLSFPNPEMVSELLFSAGGFDAKYGDKMSSVLDITYDRPSEFEGSFQASLLGGSAHLGTRSENTRFSTLSGFRYKSNRYVLGSLDTQGDYRPNFMDFQTYLTYRLSDNLQLEALGNVAKNKYQFIPEDRQTDFGNINEALRLTIYFEGQEITQFETYFGAISINQNIKDHTFLKYIISGFHTDESENFDVLGLYRIDELERDLGSEQFGEAIRNIGVGGFLNHARNSLSADVINVEHKGSKSFDNKYLQWGAQFQMHQFDDLLSEWKLIDSSGYSLPQAPGDQIVLDDLIKAGNVLETERANVFLQNQWEWERKDTSLVSLTLGVRGSYWDYSDETVISPRFNISYIPNWSRTRNDGNKIKKDLVFRLSGGYYYQAPFYREFRKLNGDLAEDIKFQKSMHFVLGSDLIIKMWDRPFKLVTEIYYKDYEDLIPYEIENVRLRYYATNNSNGYSTGVDFKINGEFVKGVESWASLSFMQSKEDLTDDFYFDRFNAAGELIIPGFTADQIATDSLLQEPGYIPRLTDQLVSFAMFFQDEMTFDPSYKAQLSIIFGTGLPYGPPTFERYKDIERYPAYKRVDVGFSKQFIDAKTKFRNPKSIFKHINEAWISVEIFNLLQINNTLSYLFVKDVTGQFRGVPNFLTSRRLNLKYVMRF